VFAFLILKGKINCEPLVVCGAHKLFIVRMGFEIHLSRWKKAQARQRLVSPADANRGSCFWGKKQTRKKEHHLIIRAFELASAS